MKRMTTIAITLLLTMSLGLSAAYADGSLQRAQERGFVYVGFANEAPYAYATPDGELTGESVEVARAVLQRLGIEDMYGVLVQFGSLIPGLQAGRFDMATAAMSIRPERCEQVSFADPDVTYGTSLSVASGNPHSLKSYSDIAANPNVRVAVMGGGEEYRMLLAMGVRENQIVTVPDNTAALQAINANRADAATMTGMSLQATLGALGNPDWVERVNDFEYPVIDGTPWVSYGAVAFRHADNELREAFNRELAKLKESGELADIIEPFGFGAADIPHGITAEEVCNR